MALKRMSIKVSEELYDWVANEAETRGLTMNAVIIFALENYHTQRLSMNSLIAANELYKNMEKEEKEKKSVE